MEFFAQVAESESAGVGIFSELDSLARGLAKKMCKMKITKEEHILMKAIILLNAGN